MPLPKQQYSAYSFMKVACQVAQHTMERDLDMFTKKNSKLVKLHDDTD